MTGAHHCSWCLRVLGVSLSSKQKKLFWKCRVAHVGKGQLASSTWIPVCLFDRLLWN